MKRVLALILVVFLALMIVGCSYENANSSINSESNQSNTGAVYALKPLEGDYGDYKELALITNLQEDKEDFEAALDEYNKDGYKLSLNLDEKIVLEQQHGSFWGYWAWAFVMLTNQ